MGTVRPNLDLFKEKQGARTLSVFAQELGVDAGTVSRVLGEKALPGNHFIAQSLLTFPHSFDQLFTVED